MYSVSDAYKKAMNGKSQKFKASGLIADKYNFTDANVVENSLKYSISNSGANQVAIGTAGIGELDITLRNMEIPRYTSNGQKLMLTISRKLEEGTYEDVPIGVFNIDAPKRTKDGLVITAYDNMSLFTKDYDGGVTNGSPFEMLTYACTQCGAELGNTEDEIKALTNGTENFGIYPNNSMKTWQDFLAYLSAALGGFATAGRDGKIYIRQYKTTVDDTITVADRHVDCSFSDYVAQYSYISIVNMADSTLEVVGTVDYSGMTLGQNPFLQYGLDDTKKAQRNAILEAVQKIKYVPFKCLRICEPAYDLADVLSCTGGIADADELFCINDISWTYNGQGEYTGTGENPALTAAQSKTDKELSGIISKTSEDEVIFYTFTNASELKIGADVATPIISIEFTSTKKTSVEFQAEILLTSAVAAAGTPCVCKVTYILNDGEIKTYYPTETWIQDGQHILNLYYAIDGIKENTLYKFVAEITMSAGSIVVPAYNARATIKGQGLAAISDWDGKIEASETIDPVAFGGLSIPPLGVAVTAVADTPTSSGVSDVISGIAFGGLSVVAFTDEVTTARMVITQNTINTDDPVTCNTSYVMTQTQFKLRTSYVYTSTAQTIDSGLMTAVSVDTTQYTVSAIEVLNG